jgi:uncharacterized protein (TIGR03437 family)
MRFSLFFFCGVATSCLAAPPAIQGVVNGASFRPGTASGAWTAITGVNLASTTRAWGDGDFVSGNLPTHLDDVSVTINGKAAYVYFISPGQINILAPDDAAIGTVAVQVTTSQGASSVFNTNKAVVSPALFTYPQLGGSIALAQAGADYSLVGPPHLLGATTATSTAAPGQSLIFYATGLGPTSPAQPAGQLVQTPSPITSKIDVTIGNQTAPVTFAGLIGSGLYQINVTVPALPTGDAPVTLTVGGQPSGQPAVVPIQAYLSPSSPTHPQLTDCISGAIDSITYSSPAYLGQMTSATIGGTTVCDTCKVKAPLYPQFAARIESALERKQTVQACFDQNGQIYQITLGRR